MQRWEMIRHQGEVSFLDTQLFYLDYAVRRLEIKWRQAKPEDLRLLRREKDRILHEIELLKIDAETLGRKIERFRKEIHT